VIRYLTVDDLLVLCDELGGLQVRDVGLLESAAHRPSATVFGDEAYPDIHVKAAALLQSLVRNHALVDGTSDCRGLLLLSSIRSTGYISMRPKMMRTTWLSTQRLVSPT
jgi:hypothetical protein